MRDFADFFEQSILQLQYPGIQPMLAHAGYIAEFHLLVEPTFGPSHCFILAKAHNQKKSSRDFFRMTLPKEGRGTVTCEVATIESSWTTDVASFLSSLTLPIAPTSPHDGRDGVYNTLTCGNHFRLTSLTWWEDAIAGWEPLDKFAEDVKSTAERLIFVLKPIRNMYDVSVFWQTEVPNDNELELIRSMTRRFEKFTLKALRAQLAENQYCYIGAFAESEAFAIQKLATETGLVTRVTFAGNAFA